MAKTRRKRGKKEEKVRVGEKEYTLQEWTSKTLIPANILHKYSEQGVPISLLASFVEEITPYIRLGGNNVNKNNPLVTINGETKTLKEWSIESELAYHTLLTRIKQGFTPEQLLFPVERKERRINPEIASQLLKIDDVEKSIGEWAEETGLHPHVIYNRVEKGWKKHELLLPAGTPRQLKSHKNELYKDEILSINGVEKTIGEWAEESGVQVYLIKRRKERGWDEEDLLVDPKAKRYKAKYKKVTVVIDGEEKTVKQLSEMAGVKQATIFQRIKSGKTGWELLFPKSPAYMTIGMKTYFVHEWMDILGITAKEAYWLYQRYEKGFTDVDLMWINRKKEEQLFIEEEQSQVG